MWCVTYVTYKIINMAHLLPLKLQPYNKIIKQCILHFHEGRGGQNTEPVGFLYFVRGGASPPKIQFQDSRYAFFMFPSL